MTETTANNSPEDKELLELRQACHDSLWVYAQTVEPHRVYGDCHRELYDWWQRCELEGIDNTLALMPRDHQKSHAMAVWVTWQIYRNPAVTVLYMSATQSLAVLQLFDIKQILTSPQFQMLSPDMVKEREKDRTKWSETAITVDHPTRKEERPRDPTVTVAGIDSNVIGAHCNILVKDDVVIDKNSETNTARQKVSAKAGHMSSILTTDGKEWCVGTRYHPLDHYQDLIEMEEEEFNDDDEIIGTRKVYAVHERQVEVNGAFLWPRAARKSDGKMFGFDLRQLARKKAKYKKDMRNFYCQYYNDPNAINEGGIDSSQFLYYDPEKLIYKRSAWHYKDKKLNVVACQDFAYSVGTSSDWSCLGILGIDEDKNIYILDLIRYQTKQPSIYWKHLEGAFLKWHFRWMRAEATAAQEVIINALRDYITAEGYNLRIKSFKPNWTMGNKEERVSQTLEPHYESGTILHYRGGTCQLLEEELVNDRPPHDDIKDCLHIGVGFDKLKPPMKVVENKQDNLESYYANIGHSRFGGRC
jgi:hypothetical protein